MNTLKYMELPTLWFLSCWKSSQDTRHLGKPGSGIQAWEEGTLSGKTPSFPIEKMLPPVGAQCLSPGAPLVTLGQSPSPELCPPWGAGSSPTEIGAGKDTAALPRPPPALSPSATSLHLLNPPGQWPHHCPGQPGPGLDNTFRENIFSNIQPKPPLATWGHFLLSCHLFLGRRARPQPERESKHWTWMAIRALWGFVFYKQTQSVVRLD